LALGQITAVGATGNNTSGQSQSMQLVFEITKPDGTKVPLTPSAPIQVPAGGSVLDATTAITVDQAGTWKVEVKLMAEVIAGTPVVTQPTLAANINAEMYVDNWQVTLYDASGNLVWSSPAWPNLVPLSQPVALPYVPALNWKIAIGAYSSSFPYGGNLLFRTYKVTVPFTVGMYTLLIAVPQCPTLEGEIVDANGQVVATFVSYAP
jgi:hypothetical protein